MRVGIVALLHESNTFIDRPTTLEEFTQNLLAVGSDVRHLLADTHHEVGGFFAGLDAAGIEAVPVFAARALPYGTVTATAFTEILERMFAELERAGQLDGILVAPHGATVSQTHPDADGQWLSELRTRIGPNTPIIGTLDLHANLSRLMVDSTDALIAYRSNPHLDQRARGLEAASLMSRTLSGELQPTQAASFPPIAINIERQRTSEPPCASHCQLADEMLRRPGVLSNSILLGFPYADVEEMGTSVLVVSDDDPSLAAECATELAARLWSDREKSVGQMVGIEEALDQAQQLEGPICLLDMGDNVGGGSPADGTYLAHALHRRRIADAIICLYDPESVEAAAAAGTGKRAQLRVGGKTDELHGKPLQVEFTVIGLCDGQFDEPEPRHGGCAHFDQGRCAIVRTDHGLTILLNSRRTAPVSLHQLTSCGINPAQLNILVAKGVHSPVAAYEPICQHMIRVNTPGCTTADMTLLNFQHRRRPMFPFEMDTQWQPVAYPNELSL